MLFQPSAILSIFVLVGFTMARQSPSQPEGVTITYTDESSKHFKYGDCIEAQDLNGATGASLVAQQPTVCDGFLEPHCMGKVRVGVPVTEIITTPNPAGAVTAVFQSARCRPGPI
ncbi:hypothetical protein M422DRAFT_246930 [Sphaerobolus stellatus SS14]|nr:hypothetical protein M422DRAFT_246930 [Sphaerobolus stellatus SS14]